MGSQTIGSLTASPWSGTLPSQKAKTMTKNTPRPDDPIWQRYAKTDPILRGMYVFDGVPEPVPHETEAAMPPPFRKPYED
jgi:hypothetical protein